MVIRRSIMDQSAEKSTIKDVPFYDISYGVFLFCFHSKYFYNETGQGKCFGLSFIMVL
jgi:hypothetical protein